MFKKFVKGVSVIEKTVFFCLLFAALFSRGAAFAQECETFDACLKSGMEAYQKNNFSGTIVYLTKTIEKAGGDADAQKMAEIHTVRGEAFYFTGKNDEALSDFTKAVELNPGLAQAYSDRAGIYALKGDGEKALEDYSKAVSLKPDFADAYNYRGALYVNRKEHEKALADFTKTLELVPNHALAALNRGYVFLTLEKYEDAIKDFNVTLSQNPDAAVAYNFRGNAYMNLGDFNNALKDYSKAIMLKPDFAEAYSNRMAVYFYKRDCKNARADAEKLLKLKPMFSKAYTNLGGVHYLCAQDYAQAVSDFNEALKLNQGDAEVYNNRANLYLIKGAYEKAAADFKKAMELSPENEYPAAGLGALYFIQGNSREALKFLDKALSLKPQSSVFGSVYWAKIMIYKESKDKNKLKETAAKAESYLKGQIKKFPSDGVNYIKLAEIYCETGMKTDEGMKLALEGEKRMKDHDTYSTLGLCAHKRKNIKKAKEYFKKAVGLNVKSPWLLYRFGLLLRDTGKKKDAKKIFEQGLKIHPGHRFLSAALKTVAK